MLKKMIGVLSAGLMIAALMSCSQSKKEEGPITLHYWTHEDPARTELETKLIAEFEKDNPNIKVERTTQGAAKLIELVQTAFAANQGPDIFNLSIEDEYSYVANGRVAPVDPKAAGYADQAAIYDSYLPEILNAVTKDGKVYGLPLEITNWCIYINKKIFRDAGLDPEKDYPKTWEDMVAVSEKLVIRDGDKLKIAVPSIIFRKNAADFDGLEQNVVDRNVKVLTRIAEILNKFPEYKVQVEGHANNTSGTEREEKEDLIPLSGARADAVRKFLIGKGVARGRLSSVGIGGTKPIAARSDRDNWWKNRRVEFILIK